MPLSRSEWFFNSVVDRGAYIRYFDTLQQAYSFRAVCNNWRMRRRQAGKLDPRFELVRTKIGVNEKGPYALGRLLNVAD